MEDINYAELFGVEEAAEESQETAETSTEEMEEAETAEAEDNASAEESVTEEPEKPEKAEMSKEERAMHAAARRRAEMQEAIDKAKADAQAESKAQFDEIIKKMGIPHPTKKGETLATVEDLQEFSRLQATNKFQQKVKAGNLEPEDVDALLANAKAAQQPQPKAEDNRAAQEAARMKIDEEIRKIGEMDASVKSVRDLVSREDFPEINAYVQKGVNLVDAYKLVNFDKLTKSAQAAAQQQAVTHARSKAHLTGTTSRGSGAVTVPKDIAAMYKEMNPGMSDSEIQKHYNKYLNK